MTPEHLEHSGVLLEDLEWDYIRVPAWFGKLLVASGFSERTHYGFGVPQVFLLREGIYL